MIEEAVCQRTVMILHDAYVIVTKRQGRLGMDMKAVCVACIAANCVAHIAARDIQPLENMSIWCRS